MDNLSHNAGKITPETAVKILAKNGINVTVEQAKNILELLIFLVNLSVDQIVNP